MTTNSGAKTARGIMQAAPTIMHVTTDHLLTAGWVGPRELPKNMIDREKVIAILRKRFVGAPADQIAAAANAIVGLREEWREVETRVVNGRCVKVFEQVE